MATRTVAQRQFVLGPLSMTAVAAGFTGLAITIAVAVVMILNPVSEAPRAESPSWIDARQQQLEIEYLRPAVNPAQWNDELQKHLNREYGAPATGPLNTSQEQQKHLQREYGAPATGPLNTSQEQQKHLQREYNR